MDYQNFQDHIRQLKTWDDPALLTKPPLQDLFTCWGVANPTRSGGKKIMEDLVQELASQGNQTDIQHWVDLAFNSYPGSENKDKILTDSRMLPLFVKIQWFLFSHQDPMFILKGEYDFRGLPYMPTTGANPVKPFAPKAVAHSTNKRMDRATSVKELRKPRLPVKPGFKEGTVGTSAVKTDWTGKAKDQQIRSPVAAGRGNLKKARLGLEQAEHAALDALQREKKGKRNKNKKRQSASPSKVVKEEGLALVLHSVTQSNRSAVAIPSQPTDGRQPNSHSGRVGQLSGTNCLDEPINSTTLTQTLPGPKVDDVNPVPLLPIPSQQTDLEPLSNWLQYPTEDSVIFDTPAEDPGQFHSSTFKVESLATIAPPGPPLIVKPPLPRNPPIWAQSRQEVCESFDWFRAYQSGVYHIRGATRGYLLSAFSASRDIFHHQGKLIISHGGGKAQSIRSQRGQHITQEADDQLAQDKSVRALLANYRSRRPLVLLIDDRYVLFPYDLGVRDITYAVLGFYTIVHAWAEYQPAENDRGRVIRYKFAFQWCESQGDPWWWNSSLRDSGMQGDQSEDQQHIDSPMDEIECTEESFTPFAHIEQISFECCICRQASPQVYENAWACLNPDCLKFWQSVNGQQLGGDLQYNPHFLQLAPPETLAAPVESLEPRPPSLTPQGLATEYAYTRGWHCKDCGRLSCRYKWEYWECMHCKAVRKVGGRIHRAAEFLFLAPPVSFKDVSIGKDSGIERFGSDVFPIQVHDGSFGQCHTYQLPAGRGFIHHIKTGNPHWNWEADEIFQEYQLQASTGALPFRRWPMRAHKCRGALLTNYFSQNAGVPYQYVGGTENTLPFDEVPEAVVKARNLIQIRIKEALKRDTEFNEVLSAAYMERQRMAFHTDDEIGLGPLVAGLSLGSPALMHFRLLARHIPQGVQRSVAVSFVLRHGDILVMDGAGVQQFYEHTVVPTNFRIAATARYINTNHPKRENS